MSDERCDFEWVGGRCILPANHTEPGYNGEPHGIDHDTVYAGHPIPPPEDCECEDCKRRAAGRSHRGEGER